VAKSKLFQCSNFDVFFCEDFIFVFFVKSKRQLSYLFLFLFEEGGSVALRNATMAIGRSRRPRGPTYARGANRSQFEDPELAVNARHLATRRAHPAFKFFYVAHSGSGKFQFRVICASHHGGAGRTHVTPANVRLRWPHASRLASCNLSFRTPLSLSLSLHFLFFSSQR
jgi:hypothetical protein